MRIAALIAVVGVLGGVAPAATTPDQLLARVRAAEAAVRDIRADMVITDANNANIAEMGKNYDDVLLMQSASIYYKRPDKMRFDGSAKNIKVTVIQNGYKRLVLAAMLRKLDDVKDAPGKRQDTLDLGFLSSRLWTDNHVSALAQGKDGVVKLKFDPRFGGPDKRHDIVWVDSATLKVLRREKHSGDGAIRAKYTYSNFVMLAGKLPIATQAKMHNAAGEFLGTVSYRNVRANTGLSDSLFSLSTR